MILGVGIDLVDVERVRRSIERWGDRWTHRIFTEAEIKYCEYVRDPAPGYAARFAAKEAFFKALPEQPKAFLMIYVEVINSEGKPAIRVHESVKDVLASLEPCKFHVSLTHEKNMAAAVVIIEKE